MITTKMTPPSAELRDLIIPTAHTLIAGTTGSGKSVLLNSILYSLLIDTSNLFYMADTKRVELKIYAKLERRVRRVTEPEEVGEMLSEVIDIMESRYESMDGKESKEPRIYVVIDELADLVDDDDAGKAVLKQLVKIGRLGRAAHIHLICCTQDPSRRTLSAQLMHNFTTCIALRCKDAIESKQIIGRDGAESLPRYGKALVSCPDGYKTISVPMTPEEDIYELCNSLLMIEHYQNDLERFEKELAECRGNFRALTAPTRPVWVESTLSGWLADGTWVMKWAKK